MKINNFVIYLLVSLILFAGQALSKKPTGGKVVKDKAIKTADTTMKSAAKTLGKEAMGRGMDAIFGQRC
uniref:Uncharacterized protein n=1 Tax=Glossina morsitans morsitans TaxID=37546 RepID=A0A1B0FBI8_GLOMM